MYCQQTWDVTVGMIIHGHVVMVADVAAENCEVVTPRHIATIKTAILRLFQIRLQCWKMDLKTKKLVNRNIWIKKGWAGCTKEI